MVFRGIFISIVLTQWFMQSLLSQQNNNVSVIIDHRGCSMLECCSTAAGHAYGSDKYYNCSNLSLALQHIQSNTNIQILSNVWYLHTVVQFDKTTVSNINIVGIDSAHPIIECNNTGGLYGENVNGIEIKGIIWDKCKIHIKRFRNATIIDCFFRYAVKEFALVINNGTSVLVANSTFVDNNGGLQVHSNSSVTICECNFTANGQNIEWTKYKERNSIFNVSAGHAIYCDSSVLVLSSSDISNNVNSAVMLIHCQFNMTDNITLYNNSAGFVSSVSKEFLVDVNEPNGATIHSQSNHVYITVEMILFMKNKAAENGGAIFLKNSNVSFHQGTIMFNGNSANNGGAIYVDGDSRLQSDKTSTIMFLYNNAMSDGGAMYVNNVTNLSIIPDYYNILVKCDDSNVALNNGICAYFTIVNMQCRPNKFLEFLEKSYLFASSPCSIVEDFDNAAVKVNKSNYINGSVLFWLHDLKLNLAVVDYFGHHLDLSDFNHKGLLSCNNTHCRDYNTSCNHESHINEFNYSIVKIDDENVVVTLKSSTNSTVCCCLNNSVSNIITLTTPSNNLTDIPVTVLWRIPMDSCGYDIGHFILDHECIATSCDNLFIASSFPPGLACPNGYMTATPSFWYNNGFTHYITSCPADNCNLMNWYEKILPEPFPHRDLQCKGNWIGLACGECNYNANYTIMYDTTECVPVDECLHRYKSVIYSLLILFGVSFLYWIIIISFIFVLLHFKFNLIAGYAYGIIFYYSVLEHIVVVFNEVVQTENCGFSNDEHYYQCFSVQTNHEILKQHLLPVLSAIGILKPPFIQYMRLCLDDFEMIDHVFLMYIHPFIVLPIVIVLFISTRKFVIMARTIGRFINSATICLLILLSYSSVSHTSLQLLRPLPYFEFKDGSSKRKGWRSYWSPAKPYFDGRHKYYVIVAIVCELVIGIGVPAFLLLQRYFTRYLNFNFMGIRVILDQLQGCYRRDCYWFAAYYMICRQIFYCVDVLIVFEVYLWTDHISVKLVIFLIISVVILVIHLWFQPYNTNEELQTKHLNLLDSAILFTLVMFLVCSLDGRSYGVTVVFWILPLLFLFNYLTYSTKLKHVFALCSICAVIILATMLVFLSSKSRFYYMNFISILCLLTSLCTLLIYITVMLKRCVYAKYCHHEDPPGNNVRNIDVSVESDK